MAILNRLFDRPNSDDISKNLGNILISGVENAGMKELYQNMLMDFLKAKKTIILVNGLLSNEEHKRILKFIHPHMIERWGYDFNLSSTSDAFDVLSAFTTSEQKADFVVSLMSMLADIPDLLKAKAQRFYLYAISTNELLGKKCNIKDLASMDIDYVTDLVLSSPLSESEKKRRIRFLGDASTYSSYMEIESYMIKLESVGILDKLSGDLGIKDILSDGNVVMLNGMISDDFRQKKMLFDAIFLALSKCLELNKSMSQVAFLIKDSDFIAGDYIKNALQFNSSYSFACYIYVDDITDYIKRNGNSILDASKAVIVFNQGSDENASFWSSFFGSRDVQDKSFSYTKKKSWNPFANMADNRGVIASPRKYKTVSTGIQKVNKPIYRPEVFRELKPNEVMIYLREPLIRRKKRIED